MARTEGLFRNRFFFFFFFFDGLVHWNLDSLLHILSRLSVTSPYLYAGMWASMCSYRRHESLVYQLLHAGAPKIWYAIGTRWMRHVFEALAIQCSVASKGCKRISSSSAV
jgi:hypothetical protein